VVSVETRVLNQTLLTAIFIHSIRHDPIKVGTTNLIEEVSREINAITR
jgi:hypothetical protein